jgi:hypothetical protein
LKIESHFKPWPWGPDAPDPCALNDAFPVPNRDLEILGAKPKSLKTLKTTKEIFGGFWRLPLRAS